MNREIKFRAKRPDNSEWVYGSLTTQKPSPRFRGDFCIFDGAWYVIDPSTIGQYTGLKDSNGTEIYEGDIVKVTNRRRDETPQDILDVIGEEPQWMHGGEELKRVSYFDGAFHFVTLKTFLPGDKHYQEPMFTMLMEERYPDVYMSYYVHYEIIGNIHDNPELLKEGYELK